MESSSEGSIKGGAIYFGLAIWITAAAMGAWLMLWFLSGEFLSSLLAILTPMALLANTVK